MNFRAFLALSSLLALAGCGSQTAASPTSTAPAPPTAQPTAPVSKPTSPSTPATPVATARVVAVGSAYDRGQTYLKAGQYAAASQQFNRSLQAAPSSSSAFFGLGNAEWGQKHFQNAFVAYRRAAQLNQRNPEYVYRTALAALYVQGGTSSSNPYIRAAISYSTRFIQMEPKKIAGYHLRFLAYGQSLQRKLQLPDAQKEVALEPRNADSYNDLGIAYANGGHYGQAANAFSHAITLQPRYYAYYIDRAEAENLNKQQDLALKDLHTAQGLAPDPKTRQTIGLAIASLTKAMQHQK
ncbi:MAG: hypothetical protein NVS2B16_23310 [Chloroflexota bacterium]